jgi:hypothetical protein
MSQRTQAKPAFNGLVTFHVTYRNPEGDLTGTAILDAVPEHKTWSDNLIRVKNSLFVLAWRFPLTIDIQFAEGELPPELEDFRDFWQFAKANKDNFVAVWERARKISYDVMDVWWEAAVYKDPRMSAPDVLSIPKEEAAKDPNA